MAASQKWHKKSRHSIFFLTVAFILDETDEQYYVSDLTEWFFFWVNDMCVCGVMWCEALKCFTMACSPGKNPAAAVEEIIFSL